MTGLPTEPGTFRQAFNRNQRSIEIVGRIVHVVGVGKTSYCGGIKAAAQEEGRSLGCLGAVGGRAGAVAAAVEIARKSIPVDALFREQGLHSRRVHAVAAQLGHDAPRPVALPRPRAHEGAGEALVVLEIQFLQAPDGGGAFVTVVALAGQRAAEVAGGAFAARSEVQGLAEGAGFGRIVVARVTHAAFQANTMTSLDDTACGTGSPCLCKSSMCKAMASRINTSTSSREVAAAMQPGRSGT